MWMKNGLFNDKLHYFNIFWNVKFLSLCIYTFLSLKSKHILKINDKVIEMQKQIWKDVTNYKANVKNYKSKYQYK